MSGTTEPDILLVCSGNLCRSPLAEKLLQRSLDTAGFGIRCLSAGTAAVTTGGPPPEIVTQADVWGLSVASHIPRQLAEEHIESASLILTAERNHRAEVVSLVPASSRKVFTLKQFARIADATPEDLFSQANTQFDIVGLVEEIADFRGLTPPPENPDYDDVPDPYRRSQTEYDIAAAQILEAIQSIERFLIRGLS